MRISNRMMFDRMLAQIALTQQNLARVQERVGSGRKVNRPSDDPLGASRILSARTRIDRNQQYERNIAVALSDLGATEAVFDSMQSLLARVSELSVQAATGTMGAPERAAIGLEVGQLIAQALELGNTKHAGRFLFAGHKTDTEPFVPDLAANPTAVTYNGDGGAISREIDEAERVAINFPGTQTWPAIFSTLIQFRDDLMANDAVALSSSTAQIDAQFEALSAIRSELGAKMRRIEVAEQRLGDQIAMIQADTSVIEDADLTESIVELQVRETAYQAALAVAGRTLNLSLLDFLR